MYVSCITTRQIVYYPVDVPSSVNISGSKSVSCWLSWAYASGVKNSVQESDVCEYTYGKQIVNLGSLSSRIVADWGGWRSRQRGHRLRSWVSALVGWRCTCSFATPACLWIHCGAILARKASGCVVLTKHSWVSSYRRLLCYMPWRLNTPHLLFLDLGARFLQQILRFLYRSVQKPFFGHFSHIQGQVHVRLFKLYPTSLPCHSSRHVENLEEISCCF